MFARETENLLYGIQLDDAPIGLFLYCCRHHSSGFCFASMIRSPVYETFRLQTSKNWDVEAFSNNPSFLGRQSFDSSWQNYETPTIISKRIIYYVKH